MAARRVASALRVWVERARADPSKGKTGLAALPGNGTAAPLRDLQDKRTAALVKLVGAVVADGDRLEVNPQESEARATARLLRSQGLSLRQVAAELERRGIRSRTGRGFAPVQVKRMVDCC